MDRIPVADERDGQQGRRNDKQSSGLERVHMVPVMVVRGTRFVLHGGGHGDIVAPDEAGVNWGYSVGNLGRRKRRNVPRGTFLQIRDLEYSS
jgi:hypothetical protein